MPCSERDRCVGYLCQCVDMAFHQNAQPGRLRRGYTNRAVVTEGQLYSPQQPLGPALGAELNVSLMSDSVSTGVRGDRPLTLHSVPSERRAGLKRWLFSSGAL